MINKIREKLTSENVVSRVFTTYICFIFIFLTVTTISYYFLPEGLLLNKHPLHNWNTAPSLFISSLQILFFNLLSVIIILIGNTMTVRKYSYQSFLPLGFLAFFTQIFINAIVLGTWSFSIVGVAVPLMDRIVGTFDIFNRSGIWEMSGQLFILCATINIALNITDGKKTTKRNWKKIKLSNQEIILFCLGLLLMITGAIIESYKIINIVQQN